MDLVGATNLIPGPNSTELAIHLGWERARGRGLVVAGACFILPAALIVGVLAWAYVRFGGTPALDGVLYGVKPAVIAVVVAAVARLVPVVAKTPALGALAVGAAVGHLAGMNELVVLGAAAGLAAAVPAARRLGGFLTMLPVVPLLAAAAFSPRAPLGRLFLFFLEVGAVLYGSGYVLLAFLQGELVGRLHWLTARQLLDAISVGQVTPGPASPPPPSWVT